MSKASLWVRQHHLVLALSLLLGSVVFLAIGLWATILLLLTVQPTVSLILVLLGGWLVLGGIAASAITPCGKSSVHRRRSPAAFVACNGS